MKKLILILTSAMSVFSLMGCGNDVLASWDKNFKTVSSLNKVTCNEKNEGQMVFSKEDDALFYCMNEKWNMLDSKRGADGTDGRDGDDCLAVDTTDAEKNKGYILMCGEDRLGVIWNGVDGTPAEDAKDCEIVSDEDGEVTFSCNGLEDDITLFKAICGSQIYDPTGDSVCYQDKMVPKLCGGEKYDKSVYVCKNDTLMLSCAGTLYDPKEYECYKYEDLYYSEVLPKTCKGVEYDKATSFCDVRDGHIYKYKVIGGEAWMAQNLNYLASEEDGSSKKTVKFAKAHTLCPVDGYDLMVKSSRHECDPDKYPTIDTLYDCEKFGRLYDRHSMLNEDDFYHEFVVSDDRNAYYPSTRYLDVKYLQGACPNGWHVPDTSEYEILLNYVYGWGGNVEDLYSETGASYDYDSDESSDAKSKCLADWSTCGQTGCLEEDDEEFSVCSCSEKMEFDGRSTIKSLHYSDRYGFDYSPVSMAIGGEYGSDNSKVKWRVKHFISLRTYLWTRSTQSSDYFRRYVDLKNRPNGLRGLSFVSFSEDWYLPLRCVKNPVKNPPMLMNGGGSIR